MVGSALESTTPGNDKDTKSRSAKLRKFPGGDGFQIAFGNQTIFRPAQSKRTKEEDSRLCVPTSRQVCLYRCNHY